MTGSLTSSMVLAVAFLASTMASTASAQDVGSAQTSAFGPGEQSTYTVKYLGLVAGSAQVTVGARMSQWGRSVWPIVAVARTESLASGVWPLHDKFISYWDFEAGRTIGSDFYADENRKRRKQRIKLEPERGVAVVTKQREGDAAVTEEHEVGSQTLDVAAAAMVLRNKALEQDEEHSIPVFTGGRLFTLKAKVEGREMISVQGVEREVIKVRTYTEFAGKLAAKRDMFVYFTADPSHLPVRVEAEFLLGNMVAELTDYKAGRNLTGSDQGGAGP